MKRYLQSLLVLSLFVAGFSLGACTNAREGGGMDSSGTAGSSSGSTGAGTSAPPTM